MGAHAGRERRSDRHDARAPVSRDGGPEVEFEVAFPRPQTYRVWVQFQRDGVVNTVHFDVPVVSQE